ncbi:DUF6339 family protein [Loigolactobacillus bifermentans]|uniref:Uncharacterized protein n=1 Tax=Loigolactobacillus bifermentans DSM 20003 TaxID=1423726 RepID=A0A0R1GLP5_9LACO|nr:DUF6339 family protein [Loigolactobacillus bifermentans]KRK34973.1 hypothetical protein FC07_GL000324 [Loigolactobacillus bifermentans DSM 20003]QGG61330.1 hypothetical protein LB003_13105 [Loigolactobacillus bifermentans]
MQIPIVTNKFLDTFDTNFDVDFGNFYKLQNVTYIDQLMAQKQNLIRTSKTYDYQELKLPEKNEYDYSFENIVLLHEQLKHLNPVEAADPRVWVALENTDFLAYHLKILKLMNYKVGKQAQSIKSRSVFSINGKKRALAINNLSSLWWIGQMMYDAQSDEPYHFVRAFTETEFRGNFVALSSSNVIDNEQIRMGIFDAVFELIEQGVIKQNRKAFTEANKIMNLVGGIRLLDFLDRAEVKQMVLHGLPRQLSQRDQ